MVVFFVLTAIAAIGAMLSLLEVPVAFLNERAGMNRWQATALTILLLALFGATAALSNSLLADVKLFGMTFFDLYDYSSSNILLPIGGLFLSIFAGWVWGSPKIKEALSNSGALKVTARSSKPSYLSSVM